MNLIPLQFIARANNATIFISLSILGMLALLVVLSGRARRAGSSMRTGARGGHGKGTFKKLAKQHNLEMHHVQLLQKAIKDQQITHPDRLFQSSSFLDRALQKLIGSIRASGIAQERKNQIIAEVFDIKQRIANTASSLKQLGKMENTHSLRVGQEVTVYSEFLPPVHTQITAALEAYLVMSAPLNANGSPIKYPLGSVLKIRLITGGRNVYAFTSKVKQSRVINGVESIIIDHSSKMTHNQLRKDMRREVNTVAYFQVVKVINEGDKKRAVVNKKSQSVGQLEDVSRGGCALYSSRSVPRGTLLKIHFNLGSANDVSVFGKVQGTKTRPPRGALMHIAFTRASIQNLNEIQSHVFGFFDN